MKHELAGFDPCSLFNSGVEYSRGYDRAVCSCGWMSAPLQDKQTLVAIWDIH